MTVDIKENSLISRETVKNCNSSKTMILTLIPFLLGARIEQTDIPSWKHGAEVTYLVQNHATTHHLDNSNSIDMNFHLRTMMTCKKLNSSLFCYFHDVYVDSSPVDIKRTTQRANVMKDVWTETILLQDIVEIAYEVNGEGEIWFSVELEPAGRAMMGSLVRLLIVGVDLWSRQIGKFETASDITNGHCRTNFIVSRYGPKTIQKSSIVNLFLIPRPDESLARPLEIIQKVDDPKCINKAHWYSFFTARELRKVNPTNVETQLNSAENVIIIDKYNFTSFSRIKTTIKNHRENSRYIIDESISLSLQNINTPEYPYCNDDNPHFHEDFSDEKKYIFAR